MMNTGLFFIILMAMMLIGGCSPATTPPTVFEPDYRWMDREIYLAYSTGDAERNNEIQKAKVRGALNEISENTLLGPGYFSFPEVDESVLSPILKEETSVNEYKSFILIWPDSVFSEFVLGTLGGETPDPNAVTVLNAAYKRKFYMIIKASCFISSASCGNITGSLGLRALIARQMGLMTGLSIKDCGDFPTDVMCSTSPSDAQWSPIMRAQWFAAENNVLETILNNPNFYKEFTISE